MYATIYLAYTVFVRIQSMHATRYPFYMAVSALSYRGFNLVLMNCYQSNLKPCFIWILQWTSTG